MTRETCPACAGRVNGDGARREHVRLDNMARSATNVAVEHALADEACGRTWVCACAACRATRATTRGTGPAFEKERARFEARLALARTIAPADRCECGRLGVHPMPVAGAWVLACDECMMRSEEDGDVWDAWALQAQGARHLYAQAAIRVRHAKDNPACGCQSCRIVRATAGTGCTEGR